MTLQNVPIGYLIKICDELLTRGINEIHASLHITRTEWQLLNLLHENETISENELTVAMLPFADATIIEAILKRFEAEQWIETPEEKTYRLTTMGAELYELCEGRQRAFRQNVTNGVSSEDYQVTLQTLRKMVDNMSPDTPDVLPTV